MSGKGFAPGDEVSTVHAQGIIIDVRPTPSGTWVFGVEDAEGRVTYVTEKALGSDRV